MNFVYPNFLWALFFVAVPIIIHLFHFRRYKKIYFSNTAFLSEIKDERSSKNKLKHLLILLSRVLAVIFLVLAFAQPFISNDKNTSQGEKYISIYIDNSFSMNSEGNGQLLFDEAKEIANNLLNNYSDNDYFNIISNDFEGKHHRFVNKTEAESFIKDLKTTSTFRNIKTVFERQKTIFKSLDKENYIVQISDYQINNSKPFRNDSLITTSIVKLSNSQKRNLFIDSLWFNNSFQLKGATNHLMVKIRNEGDEKVTGNYQLILNNKTKTIGEYNISKNDFIVDTLTFKISEIGWNTGKIQLSDYPITFDDNYFYSFFVEEKVNVLSITEQESDLVFNAVFKEIENVNYKSKIHTKLDYSILNKQHFIILDRIETLSSGLSQTLKKYVESGGSLFIVPHKNISIETYNMLLSSLEIGVFSSLNNSKRTVKNLNLNHYLLNDLFSETPKNIKLPSVNKIFKLNSKINTTEQKVLSFGNNESFLSSFNYKNGNVYLLTTPLEKEFSDFITNALFAPIIYKMSVFGAQNINLSFEIHANTNIQLKNKPENFEAVIKMKNGEMEFIPLKNNFNGKMNLKIQNMNIKAGIYDVYTDNLSYQSKVALNYNRKESILKYYSTEDLQKMYPFDNVKIYSGSKSTIQENIINNKEGKSLWKWFIIFSLLFLAFEIILLRILK